MDAAARRLLVLEPLLRACDAAIARGHHILLFPFNQIAVDVQLDEASPLAIFQRLASAGVTPTYPA